MSLLFKWYWIWLAAASPVAAQCVNTIKMDSLYDDFKTAPRQFWSNPAQIQTGAKIDFYYSQINYLSKKLGLLRYPASYAQLIRVWKWSEWHSGGYVQEWHYKKEQWRSHHYVFNELYRFHYRKNKQAIDSDSLAAYVNTSNFYFLPNQPLSVYYCQNRETIYTYMVEIWQGGKYRFFCYQDPERYAAQGSWADKYFLDGLARLMGNR